MQPHDRADGHGEPWATAVLLHPHPAMGGDRFNNVVDAWYCALPPHGVTCVRFDFTSSDVDAAAEATSSMLEVVGDAFLLGYSFGASVAASVTDARVRGWFLVAPPTAVISEGECRPSAVVWAQHDQFVQPYHVAGAEVHVVEGADHFFVGRTDVLADLALAFLRTATH